MSKTATDLYNQYISLPAREKASKDLEDKIADTWDKIWSLESSINCLVLTMGEEADKSEVIKCARVRLDSLRSAQDRFIELKDSLEHELRLRYASDLAKFRAILNQYPHLKATHVDFWDDAVDIHFGEGVIATITCGDDGELELMVDKVETEENE